MKKIKVIVLILILTITVVYYKDYLIDFTPIKINIEYYDNPGYSTWLWHRFSKDKDDFIKVMSIDNHKPGYGNIILFNGWKPYEKLEVFKKRGKLYIYYNEKKPTEKEGFVISYPLKKERFEISFPLSFSIDKENTIVFKNGEIFDEIEFMYGIE